jgi:DNA-binding transcriptional ArsR family regulator
MARFWHRVRMPFELSLRYSTPLTPINDLEEVLREFLRLVGYLPEGEDGRGSEGPIGQSLAYRLVRDCLLRETSRAWYVEELTAVLKTSKPTVYRHINKLKSLDLLEEVGGVSDGKGRKGYRLRYGNLARAWDFTEANAQNALRRYRETVNHLQELVEKVGTAPPPAPPTMTPKSPTPPKFTPAPRAARAASR